MKTVIRNSYTPKTGDYCETIVVDKETENAYIFDCDGVFTPMPQPVDVDKILEEAAAYTDEQVTPLKEKLDTIEEGAQVNVIEHILKNGSELTITNKTVNVTVPTKTSDLTNDGPDGTDTYVESSTLGDYYTKTETDTQIGYETDAREIADSGLQEQIDAIVASSDVVDIVGTYAALQAYDTSKLHDNDIIKVLTDETRDDATTYYRWDKDTSTWGYIGAEGPFYTKAESDALFTPMTRTVNGKALTTDITLTAADVHALPDSTVIPTVNDATLTIQKNGTNVATFTANSASNQTANITVPTDTSDLTNDGDGQSPFATEDYVDTYGGKIDTIGVNGTAQPIVNKTVDITVPTKTSDLTNDGSDGTNTYVEAGDLATVATSGDYDDLTNKPTIPTVNDATLTIQKNGTDVATFTANSSTNQTANITVPTDTSDLTNGAGFITSSALSNYYTKSETYNQGEVNNLINSLSIPTKTSDLTNDSGFISEDDLYSEVCGSGATITFQGSPEAPLSNFKLKGNTEQSGTPTPDAPVPVQTVTGENVVKICGKNLLEMPIESGSSNGITWTVQDDGSIILNGTSTAGVNIRANNVTIPAVEGETYTLSATGMGEAYNFGYKNAGSGANIFVVTSASPTTTAVVTSTMLSQANRLDMYIQSGKTFNNQRVTLQLELGSTATDYEPYQEQSYEINLGKNLFDGENANAKTGYILNDSGTEVSDNTGGYTRNYSAVRPNTTYTISGMAGAGTRRIYFYNGGKTFLSRTSGYSGAQKITFTTPANCYFVNVQIYTNTDTSLAMASWQLELGSQATSYAAYFEPIELCKIGGYQDYIYKSGGKWYVRKEIGKISSYAGETISTDYISTTGSLTTGATIYYVLATPTDTEITNEALIEQLDAILNSGRVYEGTNNITTVIAAGNAKGELEICYTKTMLPIATETSLGVVQIGSGLSITENGVLSVTGGGGGSTDWSDITNKPTNVSYWTNDAGYITSAAIPTNVSSFTNDAGYITSAAIPTNVSAFTNDAGYLTPSALSNYYTKSETYNQSQVNSLINSISVPTKTSDLTNDGSDGASTYVEADELAVVATTGDYDDLSNKPTIPTIVDMTGATASTAGAHGYVPAPAAGDEGKFLQGDGTWAAVSTGQTYTAGNGIDIDANNEISVDTTVVATQTDLSGKQDTLTAGDAIDITNNVISVEADSTLDVSSTKPVQNSVVTAAINNKQDTLTAGDHISISNDTISATGYVHSENPVSIVNPSATVSGSSITDGSITAAKFATGATLQLTLSTTDIGEGAPLAANTLYGVYE